MRTKKNALLEEIIAFEMKMDVQSLRKIKDEDPDLYIEMLNK